jgi:hypothetical protein
MKCCGSAKEPKFEKESLSKTNFPELILTIKNSKLKFDNIEGVFKQISNEDPTFRKNNSEDNRVIQEQDRISKEIALKKDKIAYIKDKITEIDQKIKSMTKILNVDIQEKEFVDSIKTNI